MIFKVIGGCFFPPPGFHSVQKIAIFLKISKLLKHSTFISSLQRVVVNTPTTLEHFAVHENGIGIHSRCEVKPKTSECSSKHGKISECPPLIATRGKWTSAWALRRFQFSISRFQKTQNGVGCYLVNCETLCSMLGFYT